MADSSIMIDLNDPRTADIADVISNKTSKKIISAIAESELSESEIASKLKLPLNTIGYNIKKLEKAGLIEKVDKFLWSVKGKRIHRYKIANKKIVISPKSIVKGILPTIIATGAIALGIKFFGSKPLNKLQETALPNRVISEEAQAGAVYAAESSEKAMDAAVQATPEAIQTITSIAEPNYWLWFMTGALSALLIYMIYNYFKKN